MQPFEIIDELRESSAPVLQNWIRASDTRIEHAIKATPMAVRILRYQHMKALERTYREHGGEGGGTRIAQLASVIPEFMSTHGPMDPAFETSPHQWPIDHLWAAVAARGTARNRNRVVILRMGLGRDSITMLLLLLEGKLVVEGVKLKPHEVDAVVFSDPGYEWASSYALIPIVDKICDSIGVPFFVQRKPPAEGPDGWIAWTDAWLKTRKKGGESVDLPRPWQQNPTPLPIRVVGDHRPLQLEEIEALQARCESGYYHDRPPILEDYLLRERIIQATDASCTVNSKVSPGRRLLADIARIRFGVPDNETWSRMVTGRVAVKKGTAKPAPRPPHLVLLGIAADELDREATLTDPKVSVHYEKNAFPLIEAGIRRADEAHILERHGLGDVRKSGCMMCKFQDVSWYWALSEMEPDVWRKVLAWEKVSTAAAERDHRLLSDARVIRGKTDLDVAVAKWRAEHPNATVAEVLRNEYRSCRSRYKADAVKSNPQRACYWCRMTGRA